MKKDRKPRRSFTAEFKSEAAKLVVKQGLTHSKVGNDLGVSGYLVRKWVSEYKEQGTSAFPGHGRLSPRDQEVQDLKNEVKQLRIERNILKKATAFFANHGQ